MLMEENEDKNNNTSVEQSESEPKKKKKKQKIGFRDRKVIFTFFKSHYFFFYLTLLDIFLIN